MYIDELRSEQLFAVRGAALRWHEAATLMSAALRRLKLMFGGNRSQTLTQFQVHRVPGTDFLR